MDSVFTTPTYNKHIEIRRNSSMSTKVG
jgi:hypothetical protein